MLDVYPLTTDYFGRGYPNDAHRHHTCTRISHNTLTSCQSAIVTTVSDRGGKQLKTPRSRAAVKFGIMKSLAARRAEYIFDCTGYIVGPIEKERGLNVN